MPKESAEPRPSVHLAISYSAIFLVSLQSCILLIGRATIMGHHNSL